MVKSIDQIAFDKKIDGITALEDQSNREGMRICIELRRDVNANVILNQLYKHTQLQDTFGVIMLALVNNEPKILNILDMLKYYLKHQEEVVTRRTQYDLNKIHNLLFWKFVQVLRIHQLGTTVLMEFFLPNLPHFLRLPQCRLPT